MPPRLRDHDHAVVGQDRLQDMGAQRRRSRWQRLGPDRRPPFTVASDGAPVPPRRGHRARRWLLGGCSRDWPGHTSHHAVVGGHGGRRGAGQDHRGGRGGGQDQRRRHALLCLCSAASFQPCWRRGLRRDSTVAADRTSPGVTFGALHLVFAATRIDPSVRQPRLRPRRARGSPCHVRSCRDPPRHGRRGDRQPLQPRHPARGGQSCQMGQGHRASHTSDPAGRAVLPRPGPGRGRACHRLGRLSGRRVVRAVRSRAALLAGRMPSASPSSLCFQAPSTTSATSSYDMTTLQARTRAATDRRVCVWRRPIIHPATNTVARCANTELLERNRHARIGHYAGDPRSAVRRRRPPG